MGVLLGVWEGRREGEGGGLAVGKARAMPSNPASNL